MTNQPAGEKLEVGGNFFCECGHWRELTQHFLDHVRKTFSVEEFNSQSRKRLRCTSCGAKGAVDYLSPEDLGKRGISQSQKDRELEEDDERQIRDYVEYQEKHDWLG